jgi:hypothetical protein
MLFRHQSLPAAFPTCGKGAVRFDHQGEIRIA